MLKLTRVKEQFKRNISNFLQLLKPQKSLRFFTIFIRLRKVFTVAEAQKWQEYGIYNIFMQFKKRLKKSNISETKNVQNDFLHRWTGFT